jgi:hypothetical protein
MYFNSIILNIYEIVHGYKLFDYIDYCCYRNKVQKDNINYYSMDAFLNLNVHILINIIFSKDRSINFHLQPIFMLQPLLLH